MSLFDDLPAIGAAPRAGLFDDLPDVEKDGPLTRGFKRAINSGRTAYNLTTGDAETGATLAAERADYARKNPGSPEGNELMAAWERGDGVTGGIKEVAGEVAKDWTDAPNVMSAVRATGKNLGAMGGGILEQMPNMVAPMAGMLAGGAAGSLAGPAGTVGGAFAGATAGNTAMEAAEQVDRAIRQAGINPEDKAAVKAYLAANGDTVLGQAATKGAIIGAVDTATMGAGHLLLSAPGKAAAGRALEGMGVDLADRAAVKAAMASDDFAARVASDAAYQASQKGLPSLARNATVAALEPAGEFTGEYLGQGAATGDWDTKGAALEALSSVGQGAVTFAGQKLYEAATSPLRGKDAPPMPGPGDVDQANADLGFAAGQYADLVPSEQPLLGSQPSVITVPTQDGGTTTIDRNTGPLSDIAVDVVQGQIQTGMPLRAYATTMDAQAALDQRPDGERMRVAPHPRASGRYAVVPKTAEALTAIDRKAEAQMKSEERLATVESEDGNASQVVTTGGQGSGTVAGGSAGDSPSVGGLAGGRGSAAGTSAPGRGTDTSLGDASVGDAALDELAPAPVQSISSMPAAERVKAERQAAARTEAQARGAQLTDDEVSSANTAPTEAQQAAGNYQKGHVKIGSLDISIENPAGSTRSGKEGRKSWSVQMSDHYGYIKRTEGADGEQVDVYVKAGTATDHNGPVFVVDQYNPKTGQFDEHKAFVGYRTALDVTRAYDAHFSDGTGPKRRKGITKMAPDAFTAWARHGDTSQAADKAQAEIAQSTGKESKKRSNGDLYQAAAEANKRKQERRLPTEQNDTLAVREATGAEVSVVSEKELPEADAAPAGHVSRQTAEFSRHVAKLFGKRVVFVEGMPADGFYNHGNTIYLSTTGSVHHLRLLGHEMLHALRSQSKETYAKLLEAVRDVVTDAQLKSQFSDYFNQDKDKKDWTDAQITEWLADDKNRGFLTEEWMADLSGNRWTESGFWEDVFTQVENKYGSEQAKGIISKLRLALVTALNKLKTLVRGSAFAVDGRVAEQLDQIRAALATGFADYAKAVKDGQVSEDGVGGVKFARKAAEDRKNRTLDEVRSRIGSDYGLTVAKNPRVMIDGKPFTTTNVDVDAHGPGLLIKDADAEMRRMMDEAIAESGLPANLTKDLRPPTQAYVDKALKLTNGSRFWYELSATGFAGRFFKLPTLMAERLIDIVAGTSGGQQPTDNLKIAVAAMAQDMQDLPVTTGVRDPSSLTGALSPEALTTHKFGNFSDTMQLLANLRPGVEPLPTVDLQMAAVFGIKHAEVASNPVMYETISRFLIKLRDAQNAMQPGAQPYESWQMQALLWVAERNTSDPDSYDIGMPKIVKMLQDAGIPTPGGAITEKTLMDQRVPEVMSPTTKSVPEAPVMTIETRTQLTKTGRSSTEAFNKIKEIDAPWAKKLTREFESIQRRTMRALGNRQPHPKGLSTKQPSVVSQLMAIIMGRTIASWDAVRVDTNGMGTFEGDASPNLRVPMLLAQRGGSDGKGGTPRFMLDADQRKQLASLIGKDMKQAAMADSQFVSVPLGKHDTFSIFVKRYDKEDISESLLAEISDSLGRPLNYSQVPNGWLIDVNIGGFDETAQQKAENRDVLRVTAAMQEVEKNSGTEYDWHELPRAYDSDYIDSSAYNKHIKELENAITRDTDPGRSRGTGNPEQRLGDLARLRSQVQGLYKQQESAFQQWEREARDTAAKRGAKLSTQRSDVARDGWNGSGNARTGEEVRGYGTAAPGAVTVQGTHYSKQERANLDGRYYGTGMRGAEGPRVRAANDPRLKERVYFYVDKGTGVRPEDGVGSIAHTAQLNNVYDANADTWVQAKVGRDLSVDAWMNAFESSVIDNGFDGYVTDFGTQRAAVLLGRHNVPVTRGKGGVSEAKPSTAGAKRTDLPMGKMTGAEWKKLEPRATELEDGKSYYRDEVRFSPARFDAIAEAFADRARKALANPRNTRPVLIHSDTPASMQILGWANRPLMVEASELAKIANKPGFETDEKIGGLVLDLARPGAMFWNEKQGSLNILRREDMRGAPALIAVRAEVASGLAGKGTEPGRAHLMVTAHSLENQGALLRKITSGELKPLYLDRANPLIKQAMQKKKYRVVTSRVLAPENRHARFDVKLDMASRLLSDADLVKWEQDNWGSTPKFSPARAQTETPEFKKWYEGSNLRNADGSPMVLYHGTNKDFSRFGISKTGAMGPGVYLGDEPEVANGYADGTGANVMPVYARGRYLGNREWSSYVGEHGWEKGREKAIEDGVAGVWDQKFESAVLVFDPANIKSAIGNNGQFDGTNPDIRYSPARWYFSPLQRAFEQAPDKVFGQAAQVKLWLAGNKSKLGLKDDEIQWSGINEWLDLQGKQKVSKDQVVQYLANNGVQVEEVEKGTAGYDEDNPSLPDNYFVADVDEYIAEENPQTKGFSKVVMDESGGVYGLGDSEDEAISDAHSAHPELWEKEGATEYGQYTLPGGENYRELLLTLPTAKPLSSRYVVEGQGLGAKLMDTEKEFMVTQGTYGRMTEMAMKMNAEVGGQPVPFKSNHWKEANVLAHLRFNDRTDADGNRVLFIEELQSDWGQEGKKKGFMATPPVSKKPSFDERDALLREMFQKAKDEVVRRTNGGIDKDTAAEVVSKQPMTQVAEWAKMSDEWSDLLKREMEWDAFDRSSPIPLAPFVTDTKAWLSLGIKRMIAYAVENGYGKVAFVNGAQSAERYNLSKQVKQIKVEWFRAERGEVNLKAYDHNDNTVFREQGIHKDKLEDYIGKELAVRAMNQMREYGSADLRDMDLKVGGEGMKAFYDKIVPQTVSDVLKKVGGWKLETVSINGALSEAWGIYDTTDDENQGLLETHSAMWKAQKAAKENYDNSGIEIRQIPKYGEQTGFTITPAMREQVGRGLPLFSPARAQIEVDGVLRSTRNSAGKPIAQTEEGLRNFWRWFGDSKVVDAEGKPLVVYHGTDKKFTKINFKKGAQGLFWFTSDKSAIEAGEVGAAGKGVIMELYAKIDGPANWKQYDQLMLGEFKSRGLDGAILTEADGTFVGFIIDKPTQIKSATGNRGTFDGTNPDIRMSLARKVSDAVDSTIGKLDAAVDGLSNLPDQFDYLRDRYLALGKIARVDEISTEVRKAFDGAAPADKQAVYDYLTTRGATTGRISDHKLRSIAKRIKDTINYTGDQLVARGLLDQEARDHYRDQYLPRMYLRHMLDDQAFKVIGMGKKPSDMGYLKHRKDIPQEIRDVVLGEIKDPSFLSVNAIGRAMRDVSLLDWMGKIAQNNDWVFPEIFVPWQGKKVTAYWLRAEADRIENQSAHYTPANKTKADALVAQMRATAHQTLGSMSAIDHKKFKQIPDTRRYGLLRGMWVRNEIYNDIMGASQIVNADPTWFEDWFGFGGKGTQLTQWWKFTKVAANPPGQIRNFISNMVMLQLSGIGLHRLPFALIEAARDIANNGKYWQVAKKYGVTESTFTAQELFRVKRDLVEMEAQKGKLSSLRWLMSVGARFFEGVSDLYQFSEALGKTIKIMEEMKAGKSEAEAAIEAQKWLFDYSLVPQSVRIARNAPVGMPFLCVSDDTEILTKGGWRNADTVKVGDWAATMDTKTGRLTWRLIDDIYLSDYDGEMIHVKDRHLDMLMTPNHGVVTYRRRRVPGKRATGEKYMSLEVVHAENLTTSDHIPVAAPFDHVPEGGSISDALVEVIGWYVTEGHEHNKCDAVFISQNDGPKAIRIRHTLSEAGLSFRENTNQRDTCIQFYIHAEHGRVLRALCPGKQLPAGLLQRMSVSQIALLVQTMIDGDGHTSKNGRQVFIQKDNETLDTFLAALTLIGKSWNVRPHGSGTKAVLIKEADRYCVKRATRDRVQYKGRIWCPEVIGTGTWVARRNGKVFITHNTYQVKVLPRLLEVAAKHPWRFLPWAGLLYGMQAAVASLFGVDDDELKKLKKSLPEWLQDRGHTVFLPFRDADGRLQVADVGYFFPWTFYSQIGKHASEGKIKKALVDDIGGQFSAPIVGAGAALMANYDTFTKQPIYKETDPVGYQAAAIANYAYDLMAPPFISSHGVVSPMGLVDTKFGGKLTQALAGTTNRFGDPKATEEQALGAMLGFNFYGMDPEHTRVTNLKVMEYKVHEAEKGLKQRLMNQGLTPEQRLEVVRDYRERMGELQQEMLEYAKESQVPAQLKVRKP